MKSSRPGQMFRRFSIIVGVMCVGISIMTGQSLFSSRSVGIAAVAGFVKDTRGFTANPAGLTGIRDWEVYSTTYSPTVSGARGFVFSGLAIGKRFLEDHAVAFQFTPGRSLEFVIPSAAVIVGSDPTTVDKRIEYSEPVAMGYAYRLSDALSVAIGGRLRMEKGTDTRYQLVTRVDTTYLQRLDDEISTSSTWHVDVGFHWRAVPRLTLSAVGRSIVHVRGESLPEEFAAFQLADETDLDLGVVWEFLPNLRTGLEFSTANTGAIGSEWNALRNLALRAGAYVRTNESPVLTALGFGLGWSIEFLEFDAGYLVFTGQREERANPTLQGFDPGSVRSIDMNRYTKDRLSLSVKAVFGNIRESYARIEGVELFGGVYPSRYEALAYQPVGKATVRNISGKPVVVRASFFVEKYMDEPTESLPVTLGPGDAAEIPLTAVFNERVKQVAQPSINDGNVYVSTSAVQDPDDRVQTRVLIHGKNDWDGDARSLRYFVTPDDPAVIRAARDLLFEHKDSINTVPVHLQKFWKMRTVINGFAARLTFVDDPKKSADFVQYPAETISSRGGDCDDLTVTFSSLLNSIGISTAFIDVIPPSDSTRSHIYLLADTGLEPKYGTNISSNPKRYVVRADARGRETIWIPIETTVASRGFEEAWGVGAQTYFDDVELGLGLIKGWVNIVDVY